MATKKYKNNVDSNSRHHYDLFELQGETAIHIAPFTRELDAWRACDAYAALDALESDLAPSEYVVRSRPSAAHAIYRADADKIKHKYKLVRDARRRMMALFEKDYPEYATETSVGDDEPTLPTVAPEGFALPEKKPKKKRSLRKKSKTIA